MAFGSPQWMYSSGSYELDQSLRTNDDDSAYLSWTPSSAGNQTTWTWSGWVKRGVLGSNNTIFGAGNGGTIFDELRFGSDDKLDFYTYSSATHGQRKSTAVFRDTSAWYHIVAVYDSTDSTALDRMKLYVNGEQITDLATTTNPSQNHQSNINNNIIHAVGAVYAGQLYNPYDGYLAEVNFIDGQALTPADFGETGDYGEWKPIEYSGTYGTNGFYLPFKNDYTVEGFSTTLYKGSGGTNSLTVAGVGFSPSFVWLKNREANNNGHHFLFDKLRGTSLKALRTNVNNAEGFPNPAYDRFTRFDNDGFSMIGGQFNAAYINSAQPYVAWSWDMGAATPTGFGCVTYDGTQRDLGVGGMNFSPDLVWIKRRNGVAEHFLIDKVRGSRKILNPDGTGAELDRSYFRSFDPDGFTLEPSVSNSNNQGDTYVAWGWDMGGTTATNTSGGITSTVMANTTYGQSIVSFTGTGSSSTVGHGLTSAPEVVLVMNRDIVHNPSMWHTSIPNTHYLHLDGTATSAQNTAYWNSTSPTSSVFTVGTSADVNGSSNNMIAYCFHSVSGYSKFSSYSGNGSTSGPTVTLGFRPAFIMIKSSTQAENWNIIDNVRSPFDKYSNGSNLRNVLKANVTVAESQFGIKFTDTGFQLVTTDGEVNANGQTYTYMAFAGGLDSIADHNTDGTIPSYVKANTTYGQSIVSYIGNQTSGATVGHGLSSAPEMMIIKNRSQAADWIVYHSALGNTKHLRLNLTNSEYTSATRWNNTTPSSTVFTLGNDSSVNGDAVAQDFIAYCWHSVTGYSKFGSYSGTGSTQTISGLGFQPAWIMIKRTNAAHDWVILDNQRKQLGRTAPSTLRPNDDVNPSETNQNGDDISVFTSDGFTVGVNARVNGNGDTFIYAAFADTREYAYWLDQSGNNNDWTSKNLTESDISVDSPTNNFATYNPLHAPSTGTFSEGNLKHAAGGQVPNISSMAMSSGKWYAEFYCVSGSYTRVGIANESSAGIYGGNLGGTSGSWAKINNSARLYHNNAGPSYGENWDAGDICMVAFDADAGKIWYGVNGVWDESGNPATAANPSHSSVTGTDFFFATTSGSGTLTYVANFGQDSSFASNKTAQGYQDSNEIGDFYYTPPTGFLALCTKNLPDVDVVPSEHFDVVTYTGTGSGQAVAVNFQPDFSWIKVRSVTDGSVLSDAVRGATKFLSSTYTGAEADNSAFVSAFTSTGLTLGGNRGVSQSSFTYVAWNWKAPTSSNLTATGARSIATTSKVNVDAGFEIITYTGNGTAGAKIGHSLGKAPDMMIAKNRTDDEGWWIYQNPEVNEAYKISFDTAGRVSNSTTLNNTAPTSSLITLGNDNRVNANGDNYLIYAFVSVDGYSKVGSYIGNGNANGPFVYTGFRPAFVMVKSSSMSNSETNWVIWDNERNGYNDNVQVFANQAWAEGQRDDNAGAGIAELDILSNGFKHRDATWAQNGQSGATFIYIAFAETPFKYSNAR